MTTAAIFHRSQTRTDMCVRENGDAALSFFTDPVSASLHPEAMVTVSDATCWIGWPDSKCSVQLIGAMWVVGGRTLMLPGVVRELLKAPRGTRVLVAGGVDQAFVVQACV